MGTTSASDVFSFFSDALKAENGRDGIRRSVIAKGDHCIMLDLIRMKLAAPKQKIDPLNPGRFRGTSGLLKRMQTELGDCPQYHVPKWGASHTRGGLRDDTKRGNKQHIIEFIRILNDYDGTVPELDETLGKCIQAHHHFWESFSICVPLQESDPVQKQLISILDVASLGRVQQGIVYSLLRLVHGGQMTITTKKTFAGDAQSSGKSNWRGDVQVWDGDRLLAAVEVKDAVVDLQAWEKVASTHGQHDYDLYLLATGFKPSSRQHAISGIARTFAMHLVDFCIAILFRASLENRKSSAEVIRELIDIYNEEFCRKIEKDGSIEISTSPTGTVAERSVAEVVNRKKSAGTLWSNE